MGVDVADHGTRAVELEPGENRVVLRPAVHLTGRVTDPWGAPVAGASVTFVAPSGDLAASSTTNEDGRYRLERIDPETVSELHVAWTDAEGRRFAAVPARPLLPRRAGAVVSHDVRLFEVRPIELTVAAPRFESGDRFLVCGTEVPTAGPVVTTEARTGPIVVSWTDAKGNLLAEARIAVPPESRGWLLQFPAAR